MKETKEQILEKIFKLTWSSLESHLWFTYHESREGKKFHKKCVREYAQIIHSLSKLL